jgi:hypothetical protein
MPEPSIGLADTRRAQDRVLDRCKVAENKAQLLLTADGAFAAIFLWSGLCLWPRATNLQSHDRRGDLVVSGRRGSVFSGIVGLAAAPSILARIAAAFGIFLRSSRSDVASRDRIN